MPRKAKQLDNLRYAVEVASGAMRQVAEHLVQIAESLPASQKERQLLVRQSADRLTHAAALLTAESAAGNPSTVRKVAEVAGTSLLVVAGLVVPGASEGLVAAKVEAALRANETAARCVTEVHVLASEQVDGLADAVDEQVDRLRNELLGYIHAIAQANGLSEELDAYVPMLEAPDLGVPNARQRWVHLSRALAIATREAAVAGIDPEAIKQTEVESRSLLEEMRRDIEVLAETDPSLYPPQAVEPEDVPLRDVLDN